MEKSLATKIVDKMFNNDPFSKWLGIKRIEDGEGISTLQLTVRQEMLNGFGITHGGITYSLADSALAFASNAYGRMSVSIETSINHLALVKEADVLTTQVQELSVTNKFGSYLITIINQHNEKVAIFKGMVYRTSKSWEV
ncbi:MAG: hotdog fold thioesterase [Bacteroidia bacterium]|nr:hotdog fold thioesterase [Bacteroidia bacterium]